jgi:peptide/nickel transport system substrate-binding protein
LLATILLFATVFLLTLSGCSLFPGSGDDDSPPGEIPVEWLQSSPTPELSPTETYSPPRLLTICLAAEPRSLFLYADSSIAARSVGQAIYDGPLDTLNFDLSPVIFSNIPTLGAGDALFEPVDVSAGEMIVDSYGNLLNLSAGVNFLPSGCMDASCAQTYSGEGSVQIDQFVVRFQILPGIQWSDGAPLTADDSRYAYEIAKSLYPNVRSDLIARTQAYQAVDQKTVEWRGVPGYRHEDYGANFFSPLPRHAWGAYEPSELFTLEISSRTPLGWGPYMIEEWTSGDHISLSRNPNYFRAAEGLPAFDKLVFRFIPDREGALAALLVGECDYLDETYSLETDQIRMLEMQEAGQLTLAVETGTSWEQMAFGITPLDPESQSLFQSKQTRQAVAHCIDRQRLVGELWMGNSLVPDSYLHPRHPLADPGVKRYAFDPDQAASLLENAGWLDDDGDPQTPRLSASVPGISDGTPLEFSLLTTDEPQKVQAAQILAESLAQCGIPLEVVSLPWDELLAPGPEGPVFGRNFSTAQFGWIASLYPPCSLYLTNEIPGPYPDYPKGWGGANPSGYSNPAYDQACQAALASLSKTPEHTAFHHQAQQIFADELPSLPLYLHLKMVATRPDMCGVVVDPSADSALWNLENFDYEDGCH